MTQGIYKLTFPSNKVYIGKSKNIEARWIKHKQDSNKKKYPLHLAILKYGWENIIKEILENVSDALLDQREIYWISFYDSTNKHKGYNLTIGGTGGDTFSNVSKETKEIRREKNRKPCSECTKTQISKTLKNRYKISTHHSTGKSAWNKGIPLKDETKQKLREANLGKVVSDETRHKQSLAHLGKNTYPKTEEHKQKLREANLGKVVSDETKQKMSNSRKGCLAETYICPYCKKSGKSSAMFRWHFKNCKSYKE